VFRFTIRDMLWLTAVIGLGLVLRQENRARRSSLEVMNRSEAVADEAALGGRWEVLEKVAGGKVEDFRGKPAAQMGFGDGWWQEDGPDDRYFIGGEFMVVRPGEINIDTTGVPGFTAPTKWRYKLQVGKLWMIRRKTPGERPSDFDALNDPSLTLYLLRKLELGPERSVLPPQSAVTDSDI
jgi:hypothetical protein